MRNYIILNNQNSNTISGLIIQELAPISKPLQRTQVETIDGRDGDIVTPLGYAAYNKKIKIGLYGNFDINEVIAYFATKGTVIFSNEPDKYYYYQIVDQIDYERLVRYRVATVTMHVQPFKYSATEGTITVDSSDTVSGEGSDIALDGTAEAPFNTLRHKGNATQKTYSGKNLFNINATPLEQTHATCTVNGQSITVTTDSEAYAGRVIMPLTYEAGRKIAISFDATALVFEPSNYNAQQVNLRTRGASDIIGTITLDKTIGKTVHYSITATPDNNTRSLWLYPKTTGVSGVISYRFDNIQIEYGDPTDYEPYVGGVASPNPDYPQDIQVLTGDSTVKITGKNLVEDTISGSSIDANGIIRSNSDFDTQVAFVIEGKTYTLSYTGGTVVGGYFATKPTINSASIDGTRIVNNNKTFVAQYTGYFTFRTNTGESNAQCELGNQATDYDEFKGQSYVIPFGDTYLAKIGDYADEPVKVDGTWYIRRAIGKVVLDGTETNWSGELYGGLWRATRSFSDIAPITQNTDFVAFSDYFHVSLNVLSSQTIGEGDFCQFRNTTRVYFAAPLSVQTNAEWKTWLASNNVTVYYPLATPTDEAITNQDLIDALDELYDQAHSYKDHTHITATAADGNAPAVLAVDVNEDNESTVTNAGNTTSRPILTIYGQGDIGVYINDVEVLDVALGDEEYITLDSVEMEAYKDTTANLKNRLVTGDYSKLALNAGDNKIRFTGTVTKYEISKYSRWL